MIYDLYLSVDEYTEFVNEYNYYLDETNGNDEVDYQSTKTFLSDTDTLPAAA
jgi:uncharacterized protein (DUF1919 family)